MPNPVRLNAKKIFFLASLFLFGTALAGVTPQTIAFEEGEQFNLSLSSINFNRVFIEGESIVKLSYPEHALTVDKSEMDKPDTTEGSVYIKPNFAVPITLFLTTDKGRHVSLTLTPDESVGKTLRLVAKSQTKSQYIRSVSLETSENEDIMAAMKAGVAPKDFNALRTIPRPFYIKKDIKVTLEKHYEGAGLTGYVYRLENKSNHDIALDTDLFPHRKAQSLSLSDEQLAPKKIAYLYGLYRNEG